MISTLKKRPEVGEWIMYCSRESFDSREKMGLVVRWYAAEVIAMDQGEPVLKTMTGRYHRRPFNEYYFRPHSEENMTQYKTVRIEK